MVEYLLWLCGWVIFSEGYVLYVFEKLLVRRNIVEYNV